MEIVSSYSHLGHIISSTACDSLDVAKRQHDFNGQVNNMLCFFAKLPSIVKSGLFCSYCRLQASTAVSYGIYRVIR